MYDLNLKLLCGGFYRCTPSWNRSVFGRDYCFKFYFPVKGKAAVYINSERVDIEAGKIYFLNGHCLDKQECLEYLDVYWIHFIPQSLFLFDYLQRLDPVFLWDSHFINLNTAFLDMIPTLFKNPYRENNEISNNTPIHLGCHVLSVLLMLLSDMIKQQSESIDKMPYDINKKLQPAIQYMDQNYTSHISIKDIADQCYLSSEYFLRLFKKCFKLTPYQYLLQKRLHYSYVLLIETNLSIKEIAAYTGFCNQYYFSSAFKKYYNKTPSDIKRNLIFP